MTREQQAAEAQRVAQLRGFGGRRRAARVGRRRGLQLGDARLEIADERAGDGVGRRQRALGQGRRADVTDADLEEGGGQGGFDLVEVQVELVRADADDPRVEDEVRIGSLLERLDERGLGRDARGVELELLEPRRADLVLLDRDRASAAGLLELDQEDLAGAVLVEGDGFRRARVGVRDPAGPGLLRRSASDRGPGNRSRSRPSRRS